MPKEVVYTGVNAQGNAYVKYDDGGYYYKNKNTNSQGEVWKGNYYCPNGTNVAFYNSPKKAFYQNKDGERKMLK